MSDETEDQGYEEFIVDEYLTEPVELVRATRVIEEPARPDMADIQLPPVGDGVSNVGVAEPVDLDDIGERLATALRYSEKYGRVVDGPRLRRLLEVDLPAVLAELDVERAKTAGGIHQGSHAYLSTSCLHGEHDYCSAVVRPDGAMKTPATCKFCEAACRCSCHQPATTMEATDGTR
jgi:hypothetical protein